MNIIHEIKKEILKIAKDNFGLSKELESSIQIVLNTDRPSETFGDLNCNVAMILAKLLKKAPMSVAEEIAQKLSDEKYIEKAEAAKPGFMNLYLTKSAWAEISKSISDEKEDFFKLPKDAPKKKYLVEFVSANPTGPLHLGHGRGGIIGDVLGNVLKFLGHKADKEFLINDAGNQMKKLSESLKVRCQQELGRKVEFPDDGYAGEYMIDLARKCIEHYGEKVLDQDLSFFEEYAKEQILEMQKHTLDEYGIHFDKWFSETRLHKDGSVDKAIKVLHDKDFVYEKEDALWFKSTEFGDDKDRVIRKRDGFYTYIAPDIAYHKEKYDRGYDVLINILGQDHHGYVNRLKATMEAMGYDPETLQCVLYQLVRITHAGEVVRMSKRAGTFEKLSDVIEEVGKNVARFFYLNKKASAHLEFDMSVATKKTEENPVYYIQYAYVRTKSLLNKASENTELKNIEISTDLSQDEINVLKKICSLEEVLRVIEQSYQTHMLSYYAIELAKTFHNYYARNKIIDANNIEQSKTRLFLVQLVRNTLGICLDLLGLSKPEKM